MTAAIRIDGVGKTYPAGWRKPARPALNAVSLQIDCGEIFGLIGPNGAGKSTLIKILVGALRPTSGEASIFECDVRDPEARRGLGFVPENPSLPDFLTPYEILLMARRLTGCHRADERRHCMYWLERLELAEVAHRRLREFSKGMLQRAALAHALAIEPRILILDEPLSGLDPRGRKAVVDILDDYRKSDGTLFFSSHVLHDVERLADHYGLIHAGDLVTIQAPGEMLHDDQTVTVRSRGAVAVSGFVAERDGRWRGDVRRDELWAALDALRSAQHALLEIRPTLALEDVFFRYVVSAPARQEDSRAGGPREN